MRHPGVTPLGEHRLSKGNCKPPQQSELCSTSVFNWDGKTETLAVSSLSCKWYDVGYEHALNRIYQHLTTNSWFRVPLIIYSFGLLNVRKWWRMSELTSSGVAFFVQLPAENSVISVYLHIWQRAIIKSKLLKNWNRLTLSVKELISGLIAAAHCTCRQKNQYSFRASLHQFYTLKCVFRSRGAV